MRQQSILSKPDQAIRLKTTIARYHLFNAPRRVTKEDADDWRSRMPKRGNLDASSLLRSIVAGLVSLLFKTDPPPTKIAIATFRWTRAGVLVAFLALLATFYTSIAPTPFLLSESSPQIKAGSTAPMGKTLAIPAEAVVTSPSAGPSTASNENGERAVEPTISKPPAPRPGSLMLMGVGG